MRHGFWGDEHTGGDMHRPEGVRHGLFFVLEMFGKAMCGFNLPSIKLILWAFWSAQKSRNYHATDRGVDILTAAKGW